MSPTARAKKELETQGYKVWVVEQTIRTPRMTFKRDLFNGFDLLGVKGRETKAVQVTTLSNLGSRIKKLAENEIVPFLREAGWTLEAWGYRKLRSGWAAKVVDVS